MNAQAKPRTATAALRPMREDDLDIVMTIEQSAYAFPWTRGVFRDCLRSGYPAWLLHDGPRVLGYGLLSLGAQEAHLLNVCIAPDAQGGGHGRRLLRALLQIAHARGAGRLYLEVRPTNTAAIALYHAEGFNEIGRRPRYYPAGNGREDALVMAIELFGDD